MTLKVNDTVRIKSIPKSTIDIGHGPHVNMYGYIVELTEDGYAYFHELGKNKEYGSCGSIHISHLEACHMTWLTVSRDNHLRNIERKAKEIADRNAKIKIEKMRVADKWGISYENLLEIEKDLRGINV